MKRSTLERLSEAINTPWKIYEEFFRIIIYPLVCLNFYIHGIPVKKGWVFHGIPVIMKHSKSQIFISKGLRLRSSLRSNPLSPNHPVVLCTLKRGAILRIGDNFGMTGGTICASHRITIGNDVTVGSNTVIIDNDFHPISLQQRKIQPQDGNVSPIEIQDDVFIGMGCLILKGVHIGRESVIGAGSVVTKDVPPGVVVAGNPAQVIKVL
jgi:acetyltransferase-like isoleucine patch superfamily enzyme